MSKCIFKYRCASRALAGPSQCCLSCLSGNLYFASLLVHLSAGQPCSSGISICAASIRTLPCYLTGWFPGFDPAGSWCACSVPDLVNWSPFCLTKSQLAPHLLPVAWLLLVLRCIQKDHLVDLCPDPARGCSSQYFPCDRDMKPSWRLQQRHVKHVPVLQAKCVLVQLRPQAGALGSNKPGLAQRARHHRAANAVHVGCIFQTLLAR